jgi:uncharacterized Zn-binding protein involved in type VI secretion
MPKVSTRVDVCNGHDLCAPRSFATHSSDVWAEGVEVVRQGDLLKPHGCSNHPPHPAAVVVALRNVYANGSPLTVVGSTVGCPSMSVKTGRSTVFAGGR